jgi:hypothetical protein
MPEGARRFTFHPLERRGLLLGLDAVQIVTLIAGFLLAVVIGRLVSGPSGVGLALCLLGCFAAGALWPSAGRPLVAWVPSALSWLARRASGPDLSSQPLAGSRPAGRPSRGRLVPAGVDLAHVDAEPGQPAIGVVRDRKSATCAAVLPVQGRSFSLLDPEQQVQRLEAWRAVLGSLARPGSPIRRIQWIERSAPAAAPWPGGDRSGLPAPLDPATEQAQRSYTELVSSAASTARAQEVWIVLSVDGSRGRSGGARLPLDSLRREVRLLQGQLRNADLRPGDPLGVIDLQRVIASLHRPRVPTTSSRLGVLSWPMASEEAWSCYRTDDSWHATYWIAEWPRVDVGPDFLLPLLVGGGRRTVSVIMAPVPSNRALREVRSARTADVADARLRDKAGFLPSARREREADGVARRESELAEGHAEFRFSGYVTISAWDRAELDVLCAEAEHAAQTAHLELRRLHGRQGEAFTWTLPLGRGLA